VTLFRFLAAAQVAGYSRRAMALVLLLHLLGTLFESFGLGMLLPILQLVARGGAPGPDMLDSTLWRALEEVYGAFGLEVSLAALLVTSFVAILARQAFIYLRLLYVGHVTLALRREIRDRIFSGFLSARLSHVEGDRQGHMVNDLTFEADRATECLTQLTTLGGQIIVGIVYFALMISLSPPMTGIALAILAAAGVPILLMMRRTSALSLEVTAANRLLVEFIIQRLASLRLMRLSGTEEAEHNELKSRTRHQYDRLFRGNVLIARTKVLVEPLIVAAAFLFLYFGVEHFAVSIEEMGLFLVILLRLTPVLREAMLTRQSVLVASEGLRSVERRLNALAAAHEGGGGRRALGGLEQAIAYEDVSFRYAEAAAPALDHASVSIPAHRMTALVGPSGAGKSTLIDLLPRLRDPSAGRVTLDGVPVADFALASLRQGIAYAPQSPQLFDVTVEEHIRYGKAGAGHAEIEEAARLADAHDFIVRLPKGYDTPIGESGGQLSGGQRQRLDLARALLRKAPILILDEPTSQLDAESEQRFRDALARIRAQTRTTIIVVAHRLSTVMIADKIVVMDNGRVIETGSHAELIARGGWYAEAYAKQRGRVLRFGAGDEIAAGGRP
jgi:ABC-type multidrug transport system fused ATPase/permease subunit